MYECSSDTCYLFVVSKDNIVKVKFPLVKSLDKFGVVGIMKNISRRVRGRYISRASLIRMPHNPNTLPGNLLYPFLFTMIQ